MNELAHGHHLIPVINFSDRVMSHGRGSYLYDTKGNKYLDLNSGQFCTVLGHSNGEVLRQIQNSIEKLVHTSTSVISDEVIACSNNLNRISGDMHAYSILLSTGAEAVEFCLRYAKHIKKKTGLICFDKGYHGLTLGSQSVTFGGIFANPTVQDVHPIKIPTKEDTDVSLERLESIMQHMKIAAILLEPIVSVGGMMYPPAEWFSTVRELCDRYGVLMLLDESQTGFGRTGNWFAYQTYGFIPDMVATAKGTGLGFPVSAVLFRDSLIPKEDGYTMTHYSSHQNDPFAAAVVNAGIRYIEKHQILSSIQKKAIGFLEQLIALEKKTPHIVNARGLGFMLGADLAFESVQDYRPLYKRLSQKMMERGVIIQGTNGGKTLRFLPDYLMETADWVRALEILDQVLPTEVRA
jgi:acetylornithine/succinyldiaminopimelate/putrescine aminotransferase